MEQRINIKFCVKVGKSASETLALLTVAYGEYAMKKSSVFERHKRFKVGRDVQDEPRRGQPKTQRTAAKVDRVRTLLHSDRRLGVRVIAEESNTNMETVPQIVKEDLGMGKISEKIMLRVLTHDQKNVGFTFHLIFYAMQRCFIGSLPVMKRGVFNTTRKQNDRTCSGKHRIHLGRKKHACLGRRCVSWIARGQFTMNSLHKDKR